MAHSGDDVGTTGSSNPEPAYLRAEVQRLTQELELTQVRLRMVREESDAANDELRAAKHELQSINQEYGTTSEDLEASAEELQSINTELQSLNRELRLKLEAILSAHGDLQHLIAAIDVAALILDSNLRIKRFAGRITEVFGIARADEGRSITDFADELQYDDLASDARAVLAAVTPMRREVRSRSGRRFDMRIRPYRVTGDKIDGVVVTFADVFEPLPAK